MFWVIEFTNAEYSWKSVAMATINFEKKIALTVDTQRNIKILDSLPLR